MNGVGRCFPFCAGSGDESCPCNTNCETINFNSYPIIHLHMCTPESFQLIDDPCSSQSGEKVRCNAPLAKTQDVEAHLSKLNYSLTIGESVYIGSTAGKVFSCDEDDHCDDKNICTVEECLYNRCVFTSVEGCSSTSSSVYLRDTNFYYVSYLDSSKEFMQSTFDSAMRVEGTRSTTSNYDDYPIFPLSIEFDFPFFGEVVNVLALNPNGLISLPPIKECSSFPGSIACVAFSTFSNVITPWFKDWDPSVGIDSDIYYFHQTKDSGLSLYDISADAFHVSYQNLVKWTNAQTDPQATALNSFSTSLYKDGSIRFRYSQVNEELIYDDFAGLWSSRASSNHHSYQRNYKENVTKSIKSGNDIIFCPNFNPIVCSENACVHPSGSFSLKMPEPSCAALDVALDYVCRFAGGLVIEPAIFNVTANTLSCQVPSLPGVTYDSIVTIDIDVVVPSTNSISRLSGLYLGVYTVTNSTWLSWEGFQKWKTDSAQIMVRYVNSASSCGCSALSSLSSLTCDDCSVCGGTGTAKDCNGDCFGTAYIDTCGRCTGGKTGESPNDQCDYDATIYDMDALSPLKDIVTVLIGSCLLLCSFSGCLIMVPKCTTAF